MSARQPITVIRRDAMGRTTCGDQVAVEEPLEIRLGKERLTVLMRCPGEDFDLAAGFVLTEGLVSSPEEIVSIAHCPHVGNEEQGNVLVVNADSAGAAPAKRLFYAGSGCGICGKTSIEAIATGPRAVCGSITISEDVLCSLSAKLYQAQSGFQATGCLHAAGVFDLRGRLLCAREDVGRHNAVDKVVGALAMAGEFPLTDRILLVSSRASFEICQKAAMAGIGIVAAISAPSTLAVQLARRLDMTLVGFLRGERYNIYSGERRIRQSGPDARATVLATMPVAAGIT